MPEVFDNDLQLGERPLDQPAQEKPQERSFLEVLGAASSLDNSLFSTINAIQAGQNLPSGKIDESYDPFTRAKERGISPELWDKFVYVNNDREFDRVHARILAEQTNRRIVDEAGGYGIAASLLAAASDPVNLIPFGGAVRIGKAGEMLKGVGTIAASGAASVATSEALLQSTQLTRTPEESIVNIAGGTLVAGLLGAGALGVAKTLGKGSAEQLGKSLEKGLSETMSIPDTVADQLNMAEHSVGAAEKFTTTLEQESFRSNIAFTALEKTFGQMSPMVRSMASPFHSVRDITQRLVEVPLQLEKNAEGIPTAQAVATNVKRHQAYLADAVGAGRDAFKEFRKSPEGKTMNEIQFMEEVGRAMRRSDTHDNPFVQKAAQAYRKALYDVEGKEAITMKLLPEDVKPETAPSYLNRVWNVQKITQDEPRFREILKSWAGRMFDQEVSRAKADIERLQADALEKSIKETTTKKFERENGSIGVSTKRGVEVSAKEESLKDELRTRLDPAYKLDYIEEITTNVINAIKGFDQSTGIQAIKPIARGPLKERTFHIPDELVEDFLESDVEKLAKRFSRVISAEVELKRTFGTTRFEDVKADIIKELNDLISKTESPEQRKALDKAYKNSIHDLSAMWDLVRGTYRASSARPDDVIRRAAHFARTWKYVTSLGGVVVSSISDVAMPVFVHGFNRVLGDAVVPLARSFSNPEFNKLVTASKSTTRRAGIAVEAELNARLAAIYGIGDPYANGTAMERMMEGIGRGFGKVTGLNWWNDSMKNITSMISQSRMIDAITAGQAISKKDDLWLNELGIGKTMRGRIMKQLEKHGDEIEGHRLAGDDSWDDEQARQAFYNALLKDVDRTIITKGTGDVPLWAESEVGKTLSQFQSFSMASNQRVLMSGLQRMDAQVLQGFTGLLGLGMLTYALKRAEQGKTTSDNPLVWLQEGVDRSGIVALPMWVHNSMMEPLGFGLSNVTGEKPSRVIPDKAIINLFGPTAGLVTDAFHTTKMAHDLITDGKAAPSDIRAARRLIPYQNLVGVRWLLDAAESGVNDSIGRKPNH